jgi:hypothetical protein
MDSREADTKAAEMLQVMAIWGISRTETIGILRAMRVKTANMSDAEFKALGAGLKIKPDNDDAKGN